MRRIGTLKHYRGLVRLVLARPPVQDVGGFLHVASKGSRKRQTRNRPSKSHAQQLQSTSSGGRALSCHCSQIKQVWLLNLVQTPQQVLRGKIGSGQRTRGMVDSEHAEQAALWRPKSTVDKSDVESSIVRSGRRLQQEQRAQFG